MSQYTTELRYICEMNSGFDVDKIDAGEYSPDQIILAAREKIFNFSYPVYDESHREELEAKILRHYYTREIAAETVGLWKLWLNDKLNLIMPAYNKLYAMEEEIAKRYFYNIDVNFDGLKVSEIVEILKSITEGNIRNLTTEQISRLVEDYWDKNETTHNTDIRKYSDTPQGSSNYADLESDAWLTDWTKTTDDGTRNNDDHYTSESTENRDGELKNTHEDERNDNRKTDSTDTTTNHEYGYRGGKTLYELLQDYSEKIINIDRMIVDDLKDLFFLLW